MLLQYMHKCSRRKTQDTFILPLATAPSLFLSFTIFLERVVFTKLHFHFLTSSSTAHTTVHRNPPDTHNPSPSNSDFSPDFSVVPDASEHSLFNSLLPRVSYDFPPISLGPAQTFTSSSRSAFCSSLNSSCSSEFRLCRSLLTLGEFNSSQCCPYTKSVLIILKCRLLAEILL